MTWADLFERASDHETTIETISGTLAEIRTAHGSDSDGTDDA